MSSKNFIQDATLGNFADMVKGMVALLNAVSHDKALAKQYRQKMMDILNR